MKSERISFSEGHECYSILILFQPCEKCKTIFSPQAAQKLAAGWMWPAGLQFALSPRDFWVKRCAIGQVLPGNSDGYLQR